MVQQVTKGIKISISTRFEGTHFENNTMYFVFSYTIQIENQSNDTVQLLSRHWDIFDSLNSKEIVEGDGCSWAKTYFVAQTGTHLYLQLFFNISHWSNEWILQHDQFYEYQKIQSSDPYFSINGIGDFKLKTFF